MDTRRSPELMAQFLAEQCVLDLSHQPGTVAVMNCILVLITDEKKTENKKSTIQKQVEKGAQSGHGVRHPMRDAVERASMGWKGHASKMGYRL